MITVTSAEKNRIEEQMKTALPLINEQAEFEISLEDKVDGRTKLVIKQNDKSYRLPIFYITPSTDDSTWEQLTDKIEEQKNSDGVFFIKFNSQQHVIHNAVTYAVTNQDLYQGKLLDEMCRLCSYVDLESYKTQIFDVEQVNALCERLSQKPVKAVVEEAVQKTEPKVETVKAAEPVQKVKKSEEVKQPVVSKFIDKKQAETVPVKKEEQTEALDLDIKALIHDCFGTF